MWWIPISIAGGYAAKKIIEKKKALSSHVVPPLSILEENFNRLSLALNRESEMTRVAIIGQPGSGKSTLLDLLTEHQCSPRPIVGQQTNATDWSQDPKVNLVHYYKNCVFVDVPGFDTSTHSTKSFISFFPFQSIDVFLFVVKGKVHQADTRIWNAIHNRTIDSRKILIRTFDEDLTNEEKDEIVMDYRKHFRRTPIFVSSRYQTGFEYISKRIIKYST